MNKELEIDPEDLEQSVSDNDTSEDFEEIKIDPQDVEPIVSEYDFDDDDDDDDEIGDVDIEDGEEIELEELIEGSMSRQTKEISALDYKYKDQCKTCRLAINDPEIHNLYRRRGNKEEVLRYLQQKYGDEAPSGTGFHRHMTKHFEPIERANRMQVAFFEKEARQELFKLKEMKTEEEFNRLKALINRDLAMITTFDYGKDKRTFFEGFRCKSSLLKIYKEILDSQERLLKNEVVSSDFNKIIKEFCESWVEAIFANESSEKAKEVIETMMRHQPDPKKMMK